MHYLLLYEVADDYLERRAAFRAEHLALARAAAERGELVLAGAFAEPVDGAALLFHGESPAAAAAFAAADPYVTAGLVKSFRIRPWTTVVGADAAVRIAGGPHAPASAEGLSRATLARFLRSARHWVVGSIAVDGRPQSAVVGLAVSDQLELVFDSLEATRKVSNIDRDGRVSLVMWAGAATAQIEGIARRVTGPELERMQRVYFASFPDGRERASWAGISYVHVEPTWLKTTDFGEPDPVVVELDHAALTRLPARDPVR